MDGTVRWDRAVLTRVLTTGFLSGVTLSPIRRREGAAMWLAMSGSLARNAIDWTLMEIWRAMGRGPEVSELQAWVSLNFSLMETLRRVKRTVENVYRHGVTGEATNNERDQPSLAS